jgi:ribonuclease HII
MINEEKERQRISELWKHEKEIWSGGIKLIAGVDEAGRGPLAGPVVASAVIFNKETFIPSVNDSKKLSPQKREELYHIIHEKALAIGVGIIDEKEIDKINILQATYKAMRIALGNLESKNESGNRSKVNPQHILIDGYGLPEKFIPQTALIGGDGLSFSIACASIIAKVTRDAIMVEYDKMFPEYGFAKHKGYGTKQHFELIRKFGPSPIHRKSFLKKLRS